MNDAPVSRRRFCREAAAAGLLLSPADARAASGVEQIVPGLRLIRGAVNTAVFERNGKALLIDCGDVAAIPGARVEWVLVTHHHRDQASAARSLVASGAKIAAPAGEKHLFDGAEDFWEAADLIVDHRYGFRPHLFTLRESVPVAVALENGAIHAWEGLRFEAIHTPGHTDGSLTYLVEIGGKRIADVITLDAVRDGEHLGEISEVLVNMAPMKAH